MINLSHFAIYDVSGADAESLMEYLSVAKVGGDTPIGKGVYTNFLDHAGGVRADLIIIRMAADRYRVIDGGDSGPRDCVWMKRTAEDRGLRVDIEERTDHFGCLGVWGPNARKTLQALADHPEQLAPESFPFAASRDVTLRGIGVSALRISYVGEQGWELHFPFSYGLSLWDMLYEQGVTPVGIETYANSRRLEKSLRLQNADLLTEYNLYEAGLARPKVKAADFHGKEAYVAQRERDRQPAYLCTMTMPENVDANGVARYPVGSWPIMDPETGEVLKDELGRRSYVTSVAYGPSLGKNIVMGYLPYSHCRQGRQLMMEYFHESYPLNVEAVGYRPLYDPKNERPRS